MTIHIESLTFDTIIGLLDFERERPQRVVVDVKASYSYEKEHLDYADMARLIQDELKTKKYELLEDALLGVKNSITNTYPQIKKLRLKIAKPDIIPECNVALSQLWTF